MAFLPDELWQYVFYHATNHPARRQWETDRPLEIQPFEAFHEEAESESAEKALILKATICIVCSKWRNLSAKYLFEDIRIRQGSFALAGKLEQPLSPSSNTSFGIYVRRIIIPVDLTGAWQKTMEVNARRILMASPNTQILARRPEPFRSRQPRRRNSRKRALDDIQLPQLRRVDWNNSPVHFHSSDVRGMPNFIWDAESLEILSVSDYTESSRPFLTKNFPWCSDDKSKAMSSTSLTTIHTLRLDCRVDNKTLEDVLGKTLIGIRRLIVLIPQVAIFKTSCLEVFGPQLQVVEIGGRPPSFRHGFEQITWSDVLSSCPNILAFHLHIRHFAGCEAQGPKNRSVKTLRLLMCAKDIREEHLDSELTKRHIYDKLISLTKDRVFFPSLTRIELHGSGWISLYGKSVSGLQQAAEKSQVVLSFQSIDL